MQAFAAAGTMSRLSTLVLALLVLLVSGWLAYALLTSNLPPVTDLMTRVHGRLVDQRSTYAHLDEIPSSVQEATILTEDARFPNHAGIDLVGILRSVFDDATRWCLCEGGSTITQQLAKQIYLNGDDATVRRKLQTVLLAIEIERHYSKDQILEFYLNAAYYGHGAYGAGAAAQVYWRHPISKVDLAEAAMLAGLPQAPSSYDPIDHPAAARARRAEVLQRLVGAGRISADQARLAGAQPVAVQPIPARVGGPGTNASAAAS
jgi:membrane peptidoglycan carboxypeptidase